MSKRSKSTGFRLIPSLKSVPFNPDQSSGTFYYFDAPKAYQSNEFEALARIQEFHLRFTNAQEADTQSAPFKLADAQLVIAREFGFPSWPRMKAYIDDIEPYGGDRGFSGGNTMTIEFHDKRARELLDNHRAGKRSAIKRLRAFVPRFLEATDAQIIEAEITQLDAQHIIAREHAFPCWAAMKKWLKSRPVEVPKIHTLCEEAVEGDMEKLDELLTLLREDPQRWHYISTAETLDRLGFGENSLKVAENVAAFLKNEPLPTTVNAELLERFIAEGFIDVLLTVWALRKNLDAYSTEAIKTVVNAGAP